MAIQLRRIDFQFALLPMVALLCCCRAWKIQRGCEWNGTCWFPDWNKQEIGLDRLEAHRKHWHGILYQLTDFKTELMWSRSDSILKWEWSLFSKFCFPQKARWVFVYLSMFCTICYMIDEVSWGLQHRSSWCVAGGRWAGGAEVRERRKCQFRLACCCGSFHWRKPVGSH